VGVTKLNVCSQHYDVFKNNEGVLFVVQIG